MFYVARANRIVPALAVLCIVLLVFGWFYLIPLDYRALGKHVTGSISFLSNFLYWKEAGYFDAASHEKWLLHTWSLSVEWQFYIIYPLVLVFIRKFMSIKAMKVTILLGTALCFIFSVIITYKWPSPAYYLLPTRAWEMMVGGVAYIYPITLKEKQKRILEWLGLTLIFCSYLFISKEDPWPGYLAVFPVLGAFLIIQAQRNSSFITSNIIFQKIGAWSYSIYLWHWPLVVAIYYYSLNDMFIYIGISLSVLFGFLSNKYIEKMKFKNNFSSLISYLKCKPVYMVLLIGFIGSSIFKLNGVEGHYLDAVVIANNEARNRNPYKCIVDNKFPCYIGNKENIKAIIVGDSHANALTTAVAHVFDLKESGIIALTKSNCPFIMNMTSNNSSNCYEENIRRMNYLNSNYTKVPVFWVSRTGVYLYGQSNPRRIKDIRDTQPSIYFTNDHNKADKALHDKLQDNLNLTIGKLIVNHPVHIVHPTPEMRQNIPTELAKNIHLGLADNDLSLGYELYIQRNRKIRKLLNEVANKHSIEVLDPIPYLCPNNRCMAQFEGRPIYYDGDHLSEYGNKLLTPMFKLAIDKHEH